MEDLAILTANIQLITECILILLCTILSCGRVNRNIIRTKPLRLNKSAIYKATLRTILTRVLVSDVDLNLIVCCFLRLDRCDSCTACELMRPFNGYIGKLYYSKNTHFYCHPFQFG